MNDKEFITQNIKYHIQAVLSMYFPIIYERFGITRRY